MVTTLLALDVMENGCIAAPEEGASMGGGGEWNQKKLILQERMNGYNIMRNTRWETNTCVVNCSPGVSLEWNQTRWSSVRLLKTSSGFKVQVIRVRVLSTTEA